MIFWHIAFTSVPWGILYSCIVVRHCAAALNCGRCLIMHFVGSCLPADLHRHMCWTVMAWPGKSQASDACKAGGGEQLQNHMGLTETVSITVMTYD